MGRQPAALTVGSGSPRGRYTCSAQGSSRLGHLSARSPSATASPDRSPASTDLRGQAPRAGR
jgi:hypothetical protein